MSQIKQYIRFIIAVSAKGLNPNCVIVLRTLAAILRLHYVDPRKLQRCTFHSAIYSKVMNLITSSIIKRTHIRKVVISLLFVGNLAIGYWWPFRRSWSAGSELEPIHFNVRSLGCLVLTNENLLLWFRTLIVPASKFSHQS